MFVEYKPHKFINLATVLRAYASPYEIQLGSCGIFFQSSAAAKGVLQELMNRFNDGRKVVFFKEFSQLEDEMNRLYPDDSEETDA